MGQLLQEVSQRLGDFHSLFQTYLDTAVADEAAVPVDNGERRERYRLNRAVISTLPAAGTEPVVGVGPA